MSRGTRLFAAPFLFILLVVGGCSPHLKSLEPQRHEILEARESYEGEWLEAISVQEIYRGMNATEVYLSWGEPQHRFRDRAEEKWIYFFPNEIPEQPGRVVRLYFKKSILCKWSVDRGFPEFVGEDQAEEVTKYVPLSGESDVGK